MYKKINTKIKNFLYLFLDFNTSRNASKKDNMDSCQGHFPLILIYTIHHMDSDLTSI